MAWSLLSTGLAPVEATIDGYLDFDSLAAAASDQLANANNFYRAAFGMVLIEGLRWKILESGSSEWFRIGERFCSPQY